MTIEPTELRTERLLLCPFRLEYTESREALDRFAQAMLSIAEEAERDPELLRAAPHASPIGRLDEANAARHPVLRWSPAAAD